MEQFFLTVDSYMVLGYCLAMVGSILAFKKLNSHLLAVVAMLFSEILSIVFSESVLDISLSLDVDAGRASWYGFWVIVNLASILMLLGMHKWLGLNKGKTARHVYFVLKLLIFVQVLMYLDAYLTRSEFTDALFMYAKASIQIGVISVLLYAVLKWKVSSANSVPYAAHNRAVKWYQSISALPAVKRPAELEKWEEYVKELPTDSSFGK